jgi:uncharacterized protein (TIGR02646 family)
MHFLDRNMVTEPACLGSFRHPGHTWDSPELIFSKAEIREALANLQVDRCAYCESPLYGGGHIEHFRRRHPNHFPELTFAWNNLFLSCNNQKTCGHFKDRKGAPSYDHKQLVKPDEDQPDDFFFFHSSGEVRGRDKADSEKQKRADETIRVFGLNEASLRDGRRKAVRRYLRLHGSIDEIEALSRKKRRQYLEAEIKATTDIPFCTSVHHFLKQYL